MKSFFFILLVLFLVQPRAFSQLSVNNVYDIDGNLIHGYCSDLNYHPQKGITVKMRYDDFIECKAVETNGKVVELELRCRSGSLEKPVRDGYGSKKINPKNYQYILMGKDSIFSFEGEIRQTEYIKKTKMFLWYLISDDTSEFAMDISHGRINSIDYYARKKGTERWSKLRAGTNQKLRTELLLFMGHIPDLREDILEHNYKEKDVPKLIKKLKYHIAFNTKESIKYNQFWKELKREKTGRNEIRVTNYSTSHWELEFYENENLIQSGFFSQLTPLTPDSILNYYNDKNRVVKTEFYSENNLDSVQILNDHGQVNYAYKYKLINPNSFDPKYRKLFTQVNLQPLDSSVIHDTVFLDVNGKKQQCFQIYKKGALSSSYYLEDSKKVYQMVSRKFHPKTGSIQKKLDMFTDTINFGSSIAEEAEGHTFLWVRVDEKGKITKMETVYSPFEKHDKFIQYFFDSRYKKLPSLGKYKIEGVPVTYEVLLPIAFRFTNNKYDYWMYQYQFERHNWGDPNFHPSDPMYQSIPHNPSNPNGNPTYGIPR